MADRRVSPLIVCLTDGTIIEGFLHTGFGDFNSRVSDILKQSDDFITLVDVSSNKKELDHCGKIVFLNKNQILWAIPQD